MKKNNKIKVVCLVNGGMDIYYGDEYLFSERRFSVEIWRYFRDGKTLEQLRKHKWEQDKTVDKVVGRILKEGREAA